MPGLKNIIFVAAVALCSDYKLEDKLMFNYTQKNKRIHAS